MVDSRHSARGGGGVVYDRVLFMNFKSLNYDTAPLKTGKLLPIKKNNNSRFEWERPVVIAVFTHPHTVSLAAQPTVSTVNRVSRSWFGGSLSGCSVVQSAFLSVRFLRSHEKTTSPPLSWRTVTETRLPTQVYIFVKITEEHIHMYLKFWAVPRSRPSPTTGGSFQFVLQRNMPRNLTHTHTRSDTNTHAPQSHTYHSHTHTRTHSDTPTMRTHAHMHRSFQLPMEHV